MKNIALILTIVLAGIMIIALVPANAQDQKIYEWKGKLKNGQTLSEKDLSKILKEHKDWLSSLGEHGARADLCGANLSGANLFEADLSRAILSGAILSEAILSGAILFEANLSGANLFEADLNRADLSEANLSGANLNKADLYKADLTKADLRGAFLIEADLRGAFLTKTDLRGAFLSGAGLRSGELVRAALSAEFMGETEDALRWADLIKVDLRELYYSPQTHSGTGYVTGVDRRRVTLSIDLSKFDLRGAKLSEAILLETNLKNANANLTDFSNSFFQPKDIEGFMFLGATGFSTIRFDNFKAVVDLRTVAKETGLRNEERALTSALHKYRLLGAPFYEQIFEYALLGGLTTDFGANPWRSLYILLGCIVIFSVFYTITLRRQGEDGIYKIWIPDRVRTDIGEKKPTRMTLRFLAALGVGFHFSVLSAFNIGWREINVANWIARVQRHEYIYRATGWTRTISGIQSLLSVYLLALWVLTYFGRPFE